MHNSRSKIHGKIKLRPIKFTDQINNGQEHVKAENVVDIINPWKTFFKFLIKHFNAYYTSQADYFSMTHFYQSKFSKWQGKIRYEIDCPTR